MMSSLKLYIVEDDKNDLGVFREVLTKLSCDARLYTGANALLTKPGCFEQWQRLLTAPVTFWQATCPGVSPLS